MRGLAIYKPTLSTLKSFDSANPERKYNFTRTLLIGKLGNFFWLEQAPQFQNFPISQFQNGLSCFVEIHFDETK